MKLVRPVIFAVVIAAAFFYFTTWRSNSRGETHTTSWLSQPDRVEITEHRPISRDKRWLVTRLVTRRVEA